MSAPAKAQLHRMVMDDHLCPYGLKSLWLLQREGLEVEDHPLRSREEVDRFMDRHGVETTPQTWIDGVEPRSGTEDTRPIPGLVKDAANVSR